MRFLIFLTLVVVLADSASGQTCTCESNFEWMKKTFEENDAGFQYILDKKGQTAYNVHNQLILEKIKSAKDLTECNEFMYEWFKFFRSGHIGIEWLVHPQDTTNETDLYKIWDVDIPQFQKYISEKQEIDYEGIWDAGGFYKIGIKKEGTNYIGFIIESKVSNWKPKMVKMKIEQHNDQVKTTFYWRNHEVYESGEPELVGNNHLDIGNQVLKRLKPVFPDDPLVENYIKSKKSKKPYIDELNANTLYLRIPSFDMKNKSAIDKSLAENKEKILKTKNLIIDLRNNGGGSDHTFKALLPYLYTNPIKFSYPKYLSTELNNKNTYGLLFDDELNFISRIYAKHIYKKLQKRLGEFVFLTNKESYIYERKSVYEYPKNIGVLIDRGCASATETFVLTAKQSNKVKIFGTNTFGAFDFANVISAESPCKEFRLWYCWSRSMNLPEFIDDIGLPPDYYIDETVPQYKWVEYVNEILNQ